MQIKRIIQPTGWSCLAACCAMLAGVKVEEVFESFGHEGGSLDSASPDGLRAFGLLGAVKFLADHRIILGGVQGFPRGQRLCRAPKFLLLGNAPALVITETSQKTVHAVVWDGEGVLDPHPHAPDAARLKDYVVLQWWPVGRIERGA